MELKEQLSTIEETLIMFGLENEAFRSILIKAIEAYGKNCYNKALDLAADRCFNGHTPEKLNEVILNLKKH